MHVITSKAVSREMAARNDKKMEKWERGLELRYQLEDVFNNTCRQSAEHPVLSGLVKLSVNQQSVIPETVEIIPMADKQKAGCVIVSAKRTFEAASAYEGKNVAVLNFASPYAPAGYGHKATCTQEECLCRESTLYACISSERPMEQFYGRHKDLGPMANADMIYTPRVTVFKSRDKIPVMTNPEDWFSVDVITMAAPNISTVKNPDEQELLGMFETRFTRMMLEAAANDVDVLILGAFGCGAFGNDPAIVATAAARVLEKYRGMFETVEFAIHESGRKKTNYRMFRLVLDRYMDSQ